MDDTIQHITIYDYSSITQFEQKVNKPIDLILQTVEEYYSFDYQILNIAGTVYLFFFEHNAFNSYADLEEVLEYVLTQDQMDIWQETVKLVSRPKKPQN